MQNPKVAVVILNWNGRLLLEKFLPGVIKHSTPHPVIIADNASTDDSVSWVQNNLPEVTVIINNENGGFAKGYNDALQKIDADYLVLLNSDVEVTENWLVPLIETMKNDKIAGCQPKIRSYHKPDFFEHAGASGGYLDRYHYPFCRGRMMDYIEKDEGQYDNQVQIFWASGACMMIRSSVFHEVGGFDERFFAHMEEIDLCWRCHRLGYTFEVVPSSVVYHVGGGTLNYLNPRKTFLNFRNSLLMIYKNQEKNVLGVLFKRLCLDGIAALVFLGKGQFNHFWAVFKAHVSFYRLQKSSRMIRKEWKKKALTNQVPKYPKSILWAMYIKGIKTYSDLSK